VVALGRSHGHHRAVLVTVTGQVSRPPLGRTQWPLTVDTSLLKRLGRWEVRQVIEPLAVSGLLARASVSDLEFGYSARNAEVGPACRGAGCLRLGEDVGGARTPCTQVQRLLARASQRGRKIPDLLIAAAEELGLIVLHYDADFDRISAVTGQRGQWVAPAGSSTRRAGRPALGASSSAI